MFQFLKDYSQFAFSFLGYSAVVAFCLTGLQYLYFKLILGGRGPTDGHLAPSAISDRPFPKNESPSSKNPTLYSANSNARSRVTVEAGPENVIRINIQPPDRKKAVLPRFVGTVMGIGLLVLALAIDRKLIPFAIDTYRFIVQIFAGSGGWTNIIWIVGTIACLILIVQRWLVLFSPVQIVVNAQRIVIRRSSIWFSQITLSRKILWQVHTLRQTTKTFNVELTAPNRHPIHIATSLSADEVEMITREINRSFDLKLPTPNGELPTSA